MYSETIYSSKQILYKLQVHMEIPWMTILLFPPQENCEISNHLEVWRLLEEELYRSSSTNIIQWGCRGFSNCWELPPVQPTPSQRILKWNGVYKLITTFIYFSYILQQFGLRLNKDWILPSDLCFAFVFLLHSLWIKLQIMSFSSILI